MTEIVSIGDIVKTFAYGTIGILCVIILLNFTFGFPPGDIIPDNLPLVGNLDEAAAAGFLVTIIKFIKETYF